MDSLASGPRLIPNDSGGGMTEDEQNKIAATLGAHENVLALLLAYRLKGLSEDQMDVIQKAMADAPILPSGFVAPDIGMADDLAGLTQDYQEAMKRLFLSARAKAVAAAAR